MQIRGENCKKMLKKNIREHKNTMCPETGSDLIYD